MLKSLLLIMMLLLHFARPFRGPSCGISRSPAVLVARSLHKNFGCGGRLEDLTVVELKEILRAQGMKVRRRHDDGSGKVVGASKYFIVLIVAGVGEKK